MTAMADRTKMFHVKHFGTIGAKNLTSLNTNAVPRSGMIDRFFGAIGIGRRRRLGGRAPVPEPSPGVRSAFCRGVLQQTALDDRSAALARSFD
jgi:hypothetical protein